MLAGVSYERARSAVYADGPEADYSARQLLDALAMLGRAPGEPAAVADQDCRALDKPALLRVRIEPDGVGHWVVWDPERRRVLDPMEPPARTRRPVSATEAKPRISAFRPR